MTTPARAVGTFEWLLPFEALAQWLSPSALRLPAAPSALVVGCGTSDISARLHDDSGYARVVSVDTSAEQIALMQTKRPDLTWLVADACDCDQLQSGAFDLVVDKGTLDALLCVGSTSAMLCELRRCLAAAGVYVLISLHGRELLLPLLAVGELAFDLEVVAELDAATGEPKAASLSDGATISVMVLRAKETTTIASAGREAVERQHGKILDEHYREVEPLLTPQREHALRAAWAAGSTSGGALPLHEAFMVMLDPEERLELGEEDFAADCERFVQDGRLTLDAAVRYLKS